MGFPRPLETRRELFISLVRPRQSFLEWRGLTHTLPGNSETEVGREEPGNPNTAWSTKCVWIVMWAQRMTQNMSSEIPRGASGHSLLTPKQIAKEEMQGGDAPVHRALQPGYLGSTTSSGGWNWWWKDCQQRSWGHLWWLCHFQHWSHTYHGHWHRNGCCPCPGLSCCWHHLCCHRLWTRWTAASQLWRRKRTPQQTWLALCDQLTQSQGQ